MSALTLVSNMIQYFSSHFHFFYVQRTKRRTLFHLQCLSFQRSKIDGWNHLSCIVPDIWGQWGCFIYALNVGTLSSANTISQRVYSSYCSVETNLFGIGGHWFFRSDELLWYHSQNLLLCGLMAIWTTSQCSVVPAQGVICSWADEWCLCFSQAVAIHLFWRHITPRVPEWNCLQRHWNFIMCSVIETQ